MPINPEVKKTLQLRLVNGEITKKAYETINTVLIAHQVINVKENSWPTTLIFPVPCCNNC